MSGTAKKKETEKKAPSIRVRAKGRISGLLDQLGASYRERFPDRDCRWVYAPTHKPELSNTLSRRASGYVDVCIVDLPEAGDLMPGLSPDDVVRVGDVVLMSIEAELRKIFADEAHEDAMEQGKRVEREYHEGIDRLGDEAGKDSRGHRYVRPRGHASVEVKEHEYEYEQRSGEGEQEG